MNKSSTFTAGHCTLGEGLSFHSSSATPMELDSSLRQERRVFWKVLDKKKLLACLSVLLAATVAFLAYRSRAQAVTIRSWNPSSVITAGSFIDSVNSGFYLDPAASVTSLVIAGNLGIGATPSAAIGFEGESARTIQIERRTSANTLGKALIIRAGGAASGATNKAGGDLYLLGGISTGTGTSNIQFQTASAGVSGTVDNDPSTKMTILGSGNVGIGTTAPGAMLDILPSSSTVTGLKITPATSQSVPLVSIFGTNGYQGFYVASGGHSIGFSDTGMMSIGDSQSDGSQFFNIRADKTFTIQSNTGAAWQGITVLGGTSQVQPLLVLKNGSSQTGDLLQWQNSSGTGLGVITTSGNVGIGTTSPTGKLHVSGAVTGKALGIFDETGDQNILVASASGTNRFVITNAGNVGIGTTGPTNKLEINTATDDYLVMKDSSYTYVQLGRADTNAGYLSLNQNGNSRVLFDSRNAGNGLFFTGGKLGVNTSNQGSTLSVLGNAVIGSGYAASAGPSNGLAIEGNVGIGTTTPGSKLDVLAGAIAVTRASGDTNSATIRLDQNNATTGGNYILAARNTGEFTVYDSDTGGDFLYINTSGNVGVKALASATSNSLCYSTTAISGMYTFSTCSSSERYKKNITDFAHGMDYVEQLRPVSFNWKETGKPGVGLIAEEVAAVDPRLVTYTSDGQVEGVRYGELTTVLINALKESRKEIEDLRARVEALEQK